MPGTGCSLTVLLVLAVAAAGLENNDLVFDHDNELSILESPPEKENQESLFHSIWSWLRLEKSTFAPFISSEPLDSSFENNLLSSMENRYKREIKEDNEIFSGDSSDKTDKSRYKDESLAQTKISQKYRQSDDEDDIGSGEPEGDREVEGSANSVDFHTTQSTTVTRNVLDLDSNAVDNVKFKERNIYRLSMTIKEPYLQEFERRDNEKFQKFAENLTRSVEEILHQKLRKEHHVNFVKMENVPDPFESHVHLDIHTMNTENEIREVLYNHVNTYWSLGKFTVYPQTFQLRAVLECQPGEIACDVSRCILQTQRCDFKIDCEDGSDEADCKYPTCAPDEFTCNNGQCVSQELFCDGRPDCYDRSDEINCLSTCSAEEYRCLEGTCISIDKRCNGYQDCRMGDDEESCDCRTDDFRCEDGNCVSYNALCNGVQDCRDGSDENNCDVAPCPSEDFTCGDHSCIPMANVCDGIDHCLGAEDELNCERNCTPSQFKCVTGNKCIDRIYRCDGRPDCPDRSDEDCPRGFNGSFIHDTSSFTKCGPGEKPCENGVCISKDFFCDGNDDCLDNSDEKNCNREAGNIVYYPSCRNDQFECTPGICINRLDVCNDRYECPDGSDERNCSPRRPFEEEKKLNIKVYPEDQIIKERSEVVFQCRDEGPLRAKIRWVRGNGQPLPPNNRVNNGRLEIPNIQIQHSGSYICETEHYAHLPGSRVTAQLTVEKADQNWVSTQKICGSHEATCNNEECIPKHYVCDGKTDCSDGSDETRCGIHGCEPNEFRCANKQCISKVWRCDGDKDCSDGSDEESCLASPFNTPCNYGEFKCSTNDQCIPKSYQCDHENDCLDGSDEIGCMPVYIIKPPLPMVILDPGDTLTLTCTAIGVPIPEVNWRLNWGHIPPKCSTTSVNGSGTLECPDVGVQDQGAYSCEGINIMGFIIATPDTILVVNNKSICPLGQFNSEAKHPDECLSCFCFGVATECSSANLFTYQIPLPVDRYKVVPVEMRPEIRIQSETNLTDIVPSDGDGFHIQGVYNDINRNSIIYFGLPEHFNGNQLKSYGGYLHYDVKYNGNGFINDAPAVIVTGNDITIFHTGGRVLPKQESNQSVRFTYGEWHKQDRRGQTLASREDIMMVLANINNILIKAQYEQLPQLNASISNVMLDSARNTGLDSAPFVEECRCPSGYTGLSCEKCASGYIRRKSGRWLGQCYKENPVPQSCPRTFYGDPSRGIPCQACPCPLPGRFDRTCHLDIDGRSPKCDCSSGYEGKQCERCVEGYRGNPMRGEECRPHEQCDRSGSLSPEPDPHTSTCKCKAYANGPTCNQCKPNTFSLAPTNQFGCISCFCMEITDRCVASDWYRSEIRVSFTNSVNGFSLIGLKNQDADPITAGINLNTEAREIVFNDFPDRGAGDFYYWQLPSTFLGNQITAYGGNLKYIVRYIPSPGGLTSRNSAADVELRSLNGLTLLYFFREFPEPNTAKTFTVPLLEQYWQRNDGSIPDREMLLMALADVEAIRIKATYTTHTYEAALSFVSLDTAVEYDTGKPRAIEVEKCSCPLGYQGLSCEDCAVGYTRANEGLYLGLCEPCKCNGHSSHCDPETGVCENCADHTAGNNCELCQSGYEGDATHGTPYDCQVRNGSIIPCHCNPYGSLSSACDRNGQCHCKRNVEGAECDRCRPSTFGLSRSNSDGCNECFCSGVTNQCHESSLNIQQIPVFIHDQHGFILTDSSRKEIIKENFEVNGAVNEIGYHFSDDRNKRMFWSLPSEFTGNKIKSYGGNLAFTQRIVARSSSACRKDQDIIITGNGITLYWTNLEDVTPESTLMHSVPLKESEWRHVSYNGLRVATRINLMTVLANIDAILVRASYCDEMIATYISDIVLDTAVETVTGYARASQVEVCRCPQGYTGSSCEACAPEYYRNVNDRSVSVLGSCNPCPCNGHEQSCELDWSGHVKCNCYPQYTGQYCQEIDYSTPFTTALPTTAEPTPIIIRIREPKINIVKIGDNVRYHCSARSIYNEHVTLKWEKEGGYLPIGRGIDDGSGILFIREVQISDSGTYVCKVTDGVHVNFERITLHVGDSTAEPVVSISPPYLKISEGEPAEFYCESTGTPDAEIEWVRANGDMNLNATFGGGILRIPSVTLNDAAEYRCIVRAPSGTSEKSTQLHVRPLYPMQQPDMLVLISPTKWSGFSGDTVRLICNSSRPVQKIEWSRSDRMLLPAAATQNNGILTISNPSMSDAGWYICTVTLHDGTEKSTTTSITVNPRHDMPVISVEPARQKVPQGSTAIVHCRAEAEGDETSFQWMKDRKPELGANVQATSNILSITNIQMANRGIYTCRLNRGDQGRYEASAIVDVEPREMPVLQIYPQESQTVLEGGNVDFHCRAVAGIPTPEIKWSRQDNRPLGLNAQMVSGGLLRINNITNADAGPYVCIAQNPVGTTSITVNLDVHSYPVIHISPQNGILRIKSGENLHLICSATGYPQPSVTLSKSYDEQPVIDPYETTSVGPSATIDINSVTLEDEGIYTCRASSPSGTTEDYVEVRIDDPRDDANAVEGSNDCRGDICDQPSQTIPEQSSSRLFVEGRSNIPSGGKVSIRCRLLPYSENKNIYLDWRRDDGLSMPHDSVVNDGTLYLTDLRKEDSGAYTCYGVDTYGKEVFSAKTQLNVIDFPKVELRPVKQTVRPGESPWINCIATGEQPLHVQWEAVGRPLPNNVTQSNGVLKFYGITYSDAGKYVCRARNQHGTAESVAEVSVEASVSPIVRVQASNNPVNVGEDVDLHCLVSGIINPHYVWSRPYEVQLPIHARESGNILNLPNVNVEDGGLYRCAIDSGYSIAEADLTLNITDDLSTEASSQSSSEVKYVPFGKEIVLNCRGNLQPPGRYHWTKMNGTIPAKHETRDNILVLREADSDAAGVYLCRANNGFETKETFTTVVVNGLVPYFSQAPFSFIELPPLSDANLKVDIEISFRPERPNGLILYTSEKSDGVGDFLSLALKNGIPVFKFDLGSGPTVLSADRNISLSDWHTIIIRRYRKEGEMRVDDAFSYTSVSRGKKDGLDVQMPLYIGGVHESMEINKNVDMTTGFVGCINRLLIGGQPVNLMSGNISSQSITSCEICEHLNNPCVNGVCQESTAKDGYKCLCSAGFTGSRCQNAKQTCQPGICGDGMCSETADGYVCDCPIGKTGLHCEYSQMIRNPKLNNPRSYLAYPTPKSVRRSG